MIQERKPPRQRPTATAEVAIVAARPAAGGKVDVTLRGAFCGSTWMVEVKPTALQSFVKFQAACFQAIKLWPRHAIEYERAANAKRDWADEVEKAFAEGVA